MALIHNRFTAISIPATAAAAATNVSMATKTTTASKTATTRAAAAVSSKAAVRNQVLAVLLMGCVVLLRWEAMQMSASSNSNNNNSSNKKSSNVVAKSRSTNRQKSVEARRKENMQSQRQQQQQQQQQHALPNKAVAQENQRVVEEDMDSSMNDSKRLLLRTTTTRTTTIAATRTAKKKAIQEEEERPPDDDDDAETNHIDDPPYQNRIDDPSDWRQALLYTNAAAAAANADPSNRQQQQAGNEFGFDHVTVAEPSCAEWDEQQQQQHHNDGSGMTVTLVTQCSLDRMDVFQYQCRHWGSHPISISVYTRESEDFVLRKLVESYGCDASLISITIVRSQYETDAENQVVYPYNLMRNAAFSKVRTTHAFYVDCDFMISDNAYEDIVEAYQAMRVAIAQEHGQTNSSLKASKTKKQGLEASSAEAGAMLPPPPMALSKNALVVPAFKVANECYRIPPPSTSGPGGAGSNHSSYALVRVDDGHAIPNIATKDGGIEGVCSRFWDSVPTTKEVLLQTPKYVAFPGIGFAPSHATTNYEEFYLPDARIISRIGCIAMLIHGERRDTFFYEPYLVLPVCRGVPLAQEAFIGFGEDKTSWIAHLVNAGFQLWQMNAAFCVHLPHPQTASWLEYLDENEKGEAERNPRSPGFYNEKVVRPAFEQWMLEELPKHARIIPKCDAKVNAKRIHSISGPW